MKQTRLMKTLAAMAACTLALSSATAQVGVGVTTEPVAVGVGVGGTFTAAPANDYFMFRDEAGAPVRYYYTPESTIVDPVGHTVAWTEVRPDMPATVYYERTGDRMIVKRVVLKKPVVVEKTTTTTTTTTTRP